jgi:hypothetical protein
VNPYSDLSKSEFAELSKLKPPALRSKHKINTNEESDESFETNQEVRNVDNLPPEVNWFQAGHVTKPHD